MKTLVRYNPYELLDVSPFGLLDSLFENDGAFGLDARLPAVDVRETDSAFVVEAELPGLTEKDIELKIERGVLTISASGKDETGDEKKEKFLRQERRAWKFSRSFTLPDAADETKADASFKNGILSVEIGKKPETSPRKIEIKAA